MEFVVIALHIPSLGVKPTAILVSLCIWAGMATGQDTYVPPKVSPKETKTLQEAILMYKAGQSSQAISIIKDLQTKNPLWTEPHQELSRLYYETGQKQLAIDELEASLKMDTASQLQQLYSLGRIYEEIDQPPKAISCYLRLIALGKNQPLLVEKAVSNLQALENKRPLWEKTYSINLQPLDDDINTPNQEALGRWTLDGQQMIFTRVVNGQEDLFIASWDTTAGLWKIEDFPFNTPLNEGAHAISPDGNYLIFTSCNREGGYGSCDLYLSVRKKEKWSQPVNMGPVFNSTAWDAQPCFGLDGLSLYYSSSRPGGMGGRDIWYVYQIAAGKWSNPINAGPTINTADNEESPFVHFDGQTLYFMRDGKDGLGGYDLYFAKRNINGTWQAPQNMGAPINTGSNEGALSLHPDGHQALITHETPDQRNDLFAFELPKKFQSAPLQALDVTITDQINGQPLRARIELFETNQKDTIRLSQWTDEEGKISAMTQRNVPYGVMASAEGYIMYSSSLAADTVAVRHLDIRMIPLAAAEEKIVVLRNIFFASGSAELLPASDPELNKLVWTLRNQKTMRIEVRGHTDNTGDKATNQQLSEARARAVYDYLLQRGIEPSRLTYAGFGEDAPVADNSTAEGRQMNRRTEFRVLHN